MAGQIFSNDGEIQDQSSTVGSNQTPEHSDQSSFLKLWPTPEHSSEPEDGRFPLPIPSPKGIPDLNGTIHRQVPVDEPITETHKKSEISALFDLLGVAMNGTRKRNSSSSVSKMRNIAVDEVDSVRLSTEDIFRFAGTRFIQSSSKSGDPVASPFDLSFSGLSEKEVRSVEVAEFLLTAAEEVGDEQFERARSLLTECDLHSSPTGDPIQRLVYYFSRALRERIDSKCGKQTVLKSGLIQEIMLPPRECFLEIHKKLPFGQVTQFAAIQAIVDNVAGATRIHIVDFNVKNGEQWTILMQALVSREENPVDHLKITAIGIQGNDMLEETAKRLIGFAELMALSFSFKLIMVEDFSDLKEDMLEIDQEETVAVFVEYLFSTLILSAEKLDHVMKVIREINPCVMVVTEVELNNNSPVFVNRFIESLFYTSAFFDCLELCMERDCSHRTFAESVVFGESIKIIIANDGEERALRNVTMDIWRAYFRRFGMVEAELSFSCLYQAQLVAKKFPCWRYCTVDLDGKSLFVSWKGTPTHSVTAWNFTGDFKALAK